VTVLPLAQPFHSDGHADTPQGRVGVLLCHGFTGSPYSMTPWAEHLAAKGYAVSAPRLPGHGTNWQELNATTWDDWYGELGRAFDELAAKVDRVFVGGLSMGAALALRLAEDRGDEVAGLLLVNPGLTNTHPARHVRHVLKHLVKTFPAIKNDIKKPGQDEVAYDETPLKAAASMMDAWQHVIRDLPRVTQPLVMFRSRVDHVVDPASGVHVMGKVSSRDVRERVLEDSYHVATLDNDAPAIFEESAEFIARVTGIDDRPDAGQVAGPDSGGLTTA
jgi:carboxylesterase